MKRWFAAAPPVLLLAAFFLMIPGALSAGELDPTGEPGPTMHTLDEIYKKLQAIENILLNAGVTFYRDADDDGYGDPNDYVLNFNSQPEGYVANGTDCDDTEAAANPGATEIYNDGIDNNCNGVTDELKRVFVTSQTYDGNLEGVSGAHARCQALADSEALGGTWKAWISDASTSPSVTFQKTFSYWLVDGTTKVADGFSDLTDGSLDATIKMNEAGQIVTEPPEPYLAWTGTSAGGSAFSPSCNNWTSEETNDNGRYGNATLTSADWSNTGDVHCSMQFHLYCFEQ